MRRLNPGILIGALMGCQAVASAAEPQSVAGDAVSTINHAFATELGTGLYDMGGRSIFVIRVTPRHELRAATPARPGVRLVLPIAAGSFDFNPLDTFEPEVPQRIDSFSVMPGAEFDLPQGNDWMLTPWARVGGSFSEGQANGVLFGVGARLGWDGERGGFDLSRRHELSLANIDYRGDVDDDLFVRLRNAADVRRPAFALSKSRRLVPSVYAIVDVVPDPPDVPLESGNQTVMQLELGFTLNTEPRPRIGSWRWPRLGLGYRLAGDFSGWRLVVGAPF